MPQPTNASTPPSPFSRFTCEARSRTSAAITLLLLLLLLTLTGCSSTGVPVTLPTWRKSVETYVNESGKGDPAVLRDVTYQGRPAFAQIGHPVGAKGTDAVGLLLGNHPVNNRPALIYLVGLVDQEKVEDVRVAALQPIPSQSGTTQFKWLMSDPNPQALKTYLAARDRLFRERFPDRDDPPPAYTTFPAESDQFDLTPTPTTLTVTDRRSGAQWQLPLTKS